MKLVRVSTSTPMSRRMGSRASSLVALAVAGALCLSLPAQAGFYGSGLPVISANALPVGYTVVSGNVVVETSGNRMTVDQRSQQAVVDWNSFNIGINSEVAVKQLGPTAEALFRIFSADPSVILGKLTATGRLYLINSNGILFGQGAQVNTRGLIASSLAMSKTVFDEGAFENRPAPALEGTLKLDANGNAIIDTATRPTGAVINQGVICSVDENGNSPGGFIMLVGPTVRNEGLIVADNGQVVLAAGERAWLMPNMVGGTDGDKPDITMRGMVVEIQAGPEAVNVSSLVSNLGSLQADRGNVSMVGLTVSQSGNIRAGTAVNQNGSIWLLAREKRGLSGQRFGELTLAADSVTETPLIKDGTTLAESQSYENYRGQVKLDGAKVAVAGRITAQGGIVEIGRASNDAADELTTRRVLLESTASIDVSGVTADLAMEKNFLTFKVTTDDLKDAPNQRNGFLLKKTVTVDARKGSPALFDISAAVANVERGILEKAATGGDVKVFANEFIAKQGSVIDVSGGAWRYAAGTGTTTTQLLSGGRVFDIHTASADVVYDGLINAKTTVEYAKWGVTKTYDSAMSRGGAAAQGYTEGRSAGSLTIDASQAYLGGTLLAGVTVGPQQRSADKAPAAARLVIGNALGIADSLAVNPVLRLGDVVFGKKDTGLPENFGLSSALPADQAARTVVASDIYGAGATTANGEYGRSGFGSVEVYSKGKVEVAEGSAINAPAGGSLTVYAHEIDVKDDIRLPSGTVSLNARDTKGSSGAATVTVADGRTVSTAGQWVNDSAAAAFVPAPQYVDGGTVNISSYNVNLGGGSLVDVSAGARLDSSYKLTAGKAGSISLSVYDGRPINGSVGAFGKLRLGGALRGYGVGGSEGGTLSLTAASATIGGTARNDRDLVLDPAFFRQGGFTNFNVTGHFDTEVAANTTVRPVAETRIVDVVQGRSTATGADAGRFATTALLPVQDRKATNLALTSAFKPSTPGEPAPAEVGAPGGLRVGAGAVIETDPGATVALASNSRLDVDGTILAPAGTIKLSLRTESPAVFGGEALRIGSAAKLSASGVFVPQPNAAGWVIGELKRGGSIQFDVKKNDLVIEQGAVVDVSGAAVDMDLRSNGSTPYSRQVVGSEGGSIEITATENVKLDGSFKAEGGAGAAGGNFSLDHKFHGDEVLGDDPRLTNQRQVIAVKQTREEAVSAETGTVKAEVAVAMLKEAGFGKVKLAAEDAIEFQGNVDLAMKRALVLDAPEIAAREGAMVKLAAGQVNLQNTPASYRLPKLDESPQKFVETRTGDGTLNVTGDLVELAGHVTLNGFADTYLNSKGDLRATGFPVQLNTGPIPDNVTETKKLLTGSLTTPGNLTLTAAQVYPATAVDYTVRVANVAANGTASNAAGRTLTIASNGQAATTPLSAGGKLRFEADNIKQDGVVKAPLGALEFVAASKLLVTDRSLTSVAANGLTIPFGITSDGETLFYGAIDRTATPPEKRILFEAPDETIAPKAQIDIGGGGELQAQEWVPGLGGSKDILKADNTWAIVPGLRFATRDAMLEKLKSLGFDATSAIYDSVYLAGGGALPAGYYALLPGYYALLPGAYVVTRPTAAAAMLDMSPGTTATLSNGQKAVAGRFASAASGETEARWSGFVVRNGKEVLKEAEYRLSDCSFYADAAKAAERAVPQLPADAGRVSFVATSSLALGGVLKSLPAAGGKIGEVDIAAPNIAVVSQPGAGTAPEGFIEIDAARISKFNASVMLGGTRSADANGTAVNVVSSEVHVQNAAVTTPELILAAKDRVEVAAGAVLEAKGSSATSAKDLLIDDANDSGGALLRLSAGAPVRVLRGAARGTNRGELEIAAGATLSTDRSLLLDATTTTRSFGKLDIAAGGAASFSAQKVSLGETPVDTDGLVMDRAQLEKLAKLGELTLKSYTQLDLYGNAKFGDATKGSLTIDAAGIVGHAVEGRNTATLDAQTLVLQNTGTATTAPTTGSGSLTLTGQSVTIGAGDKSISGYDQVKVAAAGDLTVVGKGSLKSAGALTLEAARITAQGKSDQTIQAGDATIGWSSVKITQPTNAAAVTAQAAAGGQLAIIGKSIEQGGNIEMPSGVLTLHARGSEATDNVLLAAGSKTVANGYSRDFAGTTIAASGGTVTLSSDHGSVDMKAGASLDVSGTAGGDAGELVVNAAEGTASLNGTLAGGATAGGESGSVTLDVGSLANFSELNSAVKAGGFGNEFTARARKGDVTIAASDEVVARKFDLVADGGGAPQELNDGSIKDDGSIEVDGKVFASGDQGGGSIRLTAKNAVKLSEDSLLDARGTSAATGAADAYSHGGKVEVAAIDGKLDFAAGATIDVSANAAGKSNGGEILFSAGRTVRTDRTPGVNMTLAGKVNVSGPGAAGSVIVEGRKTYTGVSDTAAYVAPSAPATETTPAIVNDVWNDYQAFMNNAAAIRGDIALKNADGTAFDPAALRVRAGIELQSDGDMAHTAGWNLVQPDWRLGDEAGRLTLRAGGNLTISNYLGFPNDILPSGETWGLRLVGGGDLTSADALATVKSTTTGDVKLATTTARVTSGTGDIDIAAGRDFAIANVANTKAAVYTGGKPAVSDFSTMVQSDEEGNTVYDEQGNPVIQVTEYNRFASGGGDINITVGGKASGPSSSVPVNDWLRRSTGSGSGQATVANGRWWVNRPTFRGGVGVFGGGNLTVKAAAGLENFSAVVPTSAYTISDVDGIRVLNVTGGGNLAIRTGGDVVGGSYLIGRGAGDIRSGGNFGTGTATALYLMGESDDQALRHASFEVEALGDASLKSVSNPTIQPLTSVSSGGATPSGFGNDGDTFFTYSPDASLSLVAVAGNVTPMADNLDYLSRLYPASVTLAAIQGSALGSVSDDTSLSWVPFSSAHTSVRLFSAQDIVNQRLKFGDGVPEYLPTWDRPITNKIKDASTIESLVKKVVAADSRSRVVSAEAGAAYRYQVVALDGDIRESYFEFPSKSKVVAGGDVINVTLNLQNLDATDVSVLKAGGKIGYTNFTAAGEKVDSTNQYLRIGGPGRFVVQAGGDINFGLAAGIDSVGNQYNTSLTDDQSAALTVLAGVKDEISQASIEALFVKLRDTGAAKDSAAGDAVIAELFGSPQAGSGNIKMVYSGIQTKGNSPIQVLAPHGRIDVGLPTALADKDGKIGIVTASGGSIDVLVRDDILVNLSKIVTMLGGDVTIYAQLGDIDAGRGPRDSVSSLGAKVVAINTINAKGKSVDTGLRRFQPPIDAAGSGIRTIAYDPDGPGGPIPMPKKGSVSLIAPRGTVDAGEAGVSAAGNLMVWGETVLNGSNFSSGGSSSGVPVSDAGSMAGVLSAASGSAAGASKTIENVGGQTSTPMPSFKPSFINVEVIGFGQ